MFFKIECEKNRVKETILFYFFNSIKTSSCQSRSKELIMNSMFFMRSKAAVRGIEKGETND